jgi:hypothetical protein
LRPSGHFTKPAGLDLVDEPEDLVLLRDVKPGVRIDAAIWSRLRSDQPMTAVTRLLTFVDVDDAGDARRLRAQHEAVLADGRRVVLLAGRGWSGSGGWESETAEELERTARVVVGPDEPFDGRTQADMEADHWDTLARILREHGVEVTAADLKALEHDVELSDRVLARIAR